VRKKGKEGRRRRGGGEDRGGRGDTQGRLDRSIRSTRGLAVGGEGRLHHTSLGVGEDDAISGDYVEGGSGGEKEGEIKEVGKRVKRLMVREKKRQRRRRRGEVRQVAKVADSFSSKLRAVAAGEASLETDTIA